MIKFPMGASIAATLIVVTTSAAGQAGAHPAPTRTVSTSDLDLATQAGQVALKRRVATAIERVCGSYAAASQERMEAIRQCRAEAMLRIRPRLIALENRDRQVARAD